MELRHLRYFVAVADELHFGRAAARLFVTQSTLSVQIRQLEAEVGGPLFARTSRQVELTEAGHVLYAEARRTLDQADRTLDVTRKSVAGEVGSIRIGFTRVAAFSAALAGDLRSFGRENPAVELDIRELSPAAVIDELRSGSVDLGYVPDLESDSWTDLAMVRRERMELTAALHENHPLAKKRRLRKSDLDATTLILPSTHPEIRTLAERVRTPGVVPGMIPGGGIRFAASTLGVLTLAAAGLGVGIVAAELSTLTMNGLVYRAIASVDGPSLALVSRPDETSGAVRAFLRMIAVND